MRTAPETLATKQDFQLLNQALCQEMAEIRMELVREMADIRTELCREMQELRVELCAEIRLGARRIARHMYAGMLAQMVLLLGFAYFFATYIR